MFQLRTHPAYPYVLRILLVGLAIVLVFQVMELWRTTEYGSPGTNDFIEYWSAGQLLRRGENPYDFERLLAVQKELGWPDPSPLIMWNPPWLLIWLFPFLLVDFRTASLLWLGTNLAIILATSSVLWVIFNAHQTTRRLAIAWIAGVVFAPALLTMRLGQVSGLTLLGAVGFLFFHKRERDFLAGVLLALTAAKPHTVYLVWIVVIWWVLTQRRWKILAGCLGTLAISGVALTAMRPEWIADYHAALDNPPLYWATATIGGALRGLVGVQMPEVQFLAPAVAGLLVTGYVLHTRPAISWEQAVGPILLLSVATAGFGWTHDHFVLLIPYLQGVVWLGDEEAYNTADKAVIVAGLILYSGILVGQNLLRVNEVYKFWTPWVLAGTYAYAWLRRTSTSTLSFAKPIAAPTDQGL